MCEAVERHQRSPRSVSSRLHLRRSRALSLVGLAALSFTAGCGSLSGPPPTPIVIVVTATPAPATAAPATQAAKPQVTATPAPAQAAKPQVTATASPVAAAKPTPPPTQRPAAPSPTAAPAPQTLSVGRTNSYRGLEFTVEEARSGQTIEQLKASSGKTLVGVRLRLHNPNGQLVHFASSPLNGLMKLKLPDGSAPAARAEDPFIRPALEPEESITGWAYFELNQPVPLEPLALNIGGSQETVVTIPFTGPEPKIARRTFEYLRSSEPVRGLIWSVSGGELRLDLPGQQANPGQEFIVVKIRATNPTAAPVALRSDGSMPQYGADYLRMRADNGVLLQVSAELSPLPTEFPGKAEQDTLYAWQLPIGSKNPALVVLSPDGSQYVQELGPLPPP